MVRTFVATLLSAAAVYNGSGPCAAQGTRLVGQHVQAHLFDDGSHQTTWEMRSLNTSGSSLRQYSFRSSTNTLEKVLDAEGNELRVETNRTGSGFEFVLHMIEPVPPGEEFTLIKQDRRIQLTRREADHWIYEVNHTPGPAAEYTHTIRLPTGAELVSAAPSPTRRYEEEDVTVLFYEQHLRNRESFWCRVGYRASQGITQRTVDIPMRDGVLLATNLYFPAGVSRPHSIILIRTPYNKELAEEYGSYFAGWDYVVAIQDVRGRFASQGGWEPFVHEGTDGYDTVEWLASQEWSSGRVGMYGASYAGSAQFAAAIQRPPHLITIIPNVTPAMPFDNFPYEGGALLIGGAVRWADIVENAHTVEEISQRVQTGLELDWHRPLLDLPVIDLDKKIVGREVPYFRHWVHHNTQDSYWEPVNYLEALASLDIPVFLQGGWLDSGNRGNKLAYAHLKNSRSPHIKMIMGPWLHSDQASRYLGGQDMGPDADVDLFALYRRWFDYWLKGIDNGILDDPLVQVYLMGENRWLRGSTYPLPGTVSQPYYLTSATDSEARHSTGRLLRDPPSAPQGYDQYTYDPGDPTPAFYAHLKRRTLQQYHVHIQTRDDVVSYETAPFEEPLHIAGPISVVLYASSSARDTDWCATLYSISETGEPQPIGLTFGILRARFRDSRASPSLLRPDSIYEYSIDLSHTAVSLPVGYRLRLDIASASFPEYSRNLNTGGHSEMEVDYVVAVQRIFHTASYQSRLVLPVVDPTAHE